MILSKALRAAAGNVAPAPSSTDPQFNYVSMLLHGDGTNGSQNNTFVDSSTNNFTITRNGNTTQGSLSPYGNLWSNYFDGSGDRLSFPAGSSTAFGTSNFTVEGWINSSNASATFFYIIDNRNASQTNNWAFFVDNSSYLQWYNGSSSLIISTGPTVVRGQWHHFAYSRSGSTGRLFLNGTLLGGWTDNTNYSTSPTTAYIASRYSNTENLMGSLSNIRIVKGTALYTSNFTPSTTPLTAVSGTSLLTCQSNRFIDNSANNFTLTRSGDVRVTKEAPFLPTAAYSTSVIGGSGYFDGTGDYLSTSSVTFAGDFTVEGWVYINNLSSNRIMVQIGDDSTATGPAFYVTSTGKFNVYASSTIISGVANIITNTWYHLAVCRSGSTIKSYVNGVLDVTTTNSTTFTGLVRVGTEFFGGAVVSSSMMNGYISDLRLVAGTAVYTTNFTPPTAPLTAITNTSLLLSFTNAGIFDNAAKNDLETVGNAQISTSVKKYGTGSLAFDGTGDWLAPNDALPYTFGGGDFTVEFWLYLNSTQTALLYDGRPVSGVGATPTIYVASNVLYYFTNNANRITGSTLSNTTWTHVALCKSGGSTRLFVNGTQVGSTYADSVTYTNTAGRPLIGASGETVGQFPLNGYIDDLRITKGYARYTANFTPPTAAFPNQ